MKKTNYRGFYNPKTFAAFETAYNDAVAELENIHVSISANNNKMGDVPSVSLLPFMCCPAICRRTCAGDCYAARMAGRLPSVRKAWARNTAIHANDAGRYWSEILHWLRKNKPAAFRYHVSGDLCSMEDVRQIVRIADAVPDTLFMLYTKSYSIIADAVRAGILTGRENNLRVNLSAWSPAGVNPEWLRMAFGGLLARFNYTDIADRDADAVPAGCAFCPGAGCDGCAARGVMCYAGADAGRHGVIFHRH